MLSQQLLQQRIRTAFIHLWLRGALGAQEVTRIQPAACMSVVEHRRHQARRPNLAVPDHFGVAHLVDVAVQQRRRAFQILNELGDQRLGAFRRQQAADKIAVITTQRLLHGAQTGDRSG